MQSTQTLVEIYNTCAKDLYKNFMLLLETILPPMVCLLVCAYIAIQEDSVCYEVKISD